MAHAEHHITPQKTLIRVFIALVVLTILTVLTSRLDLGPLNVPLALTIAVTKGSFVVLIFMGLRYDNKINAVVLSVGAAFVLIFLVFTLFDTSFRGDLPNTTKGTIMEEERQNEALRQRDPGPPQSIVPPSQ
jgi:cytochrome c oxidase subunit 4